MKVYNLNDVVTIEGVTSGSPMDFIGQLENNKINIFNKRTQLYEVFQLDHTEIQDFNGGQVGNEIETKAYLDDVFTSHTIDEETGGLKISPKYAPDGWFQQIFELEFETSRLNSIHEKDWQNNDIGWASLKFYDASENELTDQTAINTQCVRTDLDWMPDRDYMIKAGFISQIKTPLDVATQTIPQDVYVWALAGVLPDIYGGVQTTFAEGGINMAYVGDRRKAGLDGVAGTILHYSHPQLGSGVGTNKIRFVCRHPVGYKHRFQVIFDIFRAP